MLAAALAILVLMYQTMFITYVAEEVRTSYRKLVDSLEVLPHRQSPYLEHNLFHLLVRGLKLSDEDQHHLSGVVVCILSIHQWDEVTNSFEESSQTLVTKGDNIRHNRRHVSHIFPLQ